MFKNMIQIDLDNLHSLNQLKYYLFILVQNYIGMETRNQINELQNFLFDEFEEEFEDQAQQEIRQMIKQLNQSKDVIGRFTSLLNQVGKTGTQKKMIIKSFMGTQFYKSRPQIPPIPKQQIKPTIQNYEIERLHLNDLYSDRQKMLKSFSTSNNKLCLQYHLYEILMEALVDKNQILKDQFKKLMHKDIREDKEQYEAIKKVKQSIELQGRGNSKITNSFKNIDNKVGCMFDHLMLIKKQLNPIDVIDLQRLIEKSKKSKQQVEKKSIILFIGDTGSGKTTTILSLLGYRMVKKIFKGMTWITTDQSLTDQKLKLLHSSPEMKSITRYALAILPKEKLDYQEQIWFVDTPGFGDSAGSEVDLANGIGTVQAIRACKYVRTVVVISSQSWGARGKGLRDLAKLLGQIFGNYSMVRKTVTYVFNRYTPEAVKEMNSALKSLVENPKPQDKSNQNLMSLYCDLIEKTMDFDDIINFNPLIAGQYKKVLKKIMASQKLKNPNEYFNFSFTQSTLQSIKQQCIIYDRIIKLNFSKNNYQSVNFYLNIFKQFAQLIPLQNIANQYVNTLEYIKNCIQKKFQSIQSSFNYKISSNSVTNLDIKAYMKDTKALKNLDQLKSLINISCSADLQANLQKQFKNVLLRCKQDQNNLQNFDLLILIHQHAKKNQIKNLIQMCDKLQKDLLNKLQQYKKKLKEQLTKYNHQECIYILKKSKEIIKIISKQKQNTSVVQKSNTNQLTQLIINYFKEQQQLYIKYFYQLNQTDKCQIMNQILNNLIEITKNHHFMELFNQNSSSEIKKIIQSLNNINLSKITEYENQLNTLLLNNPQNRDKITQKMKNMKILQGLNTSNFEVSIKLQKFTQKIKFLIKNHQKQLNDFCKFVKQYKTYSNKKKLKQIIKNLQKTINQSTNLNNLIEDQQINKKNKIIIDNTYQCIEQYFIDRKKNILKISQIKNKMFEINSKQNIQDEVKLLFRIRQELKDFENIKNLIQISDLKDLIKDINQIFKQLIDKLNNNFENFKSQNKIQQISQKNLKKVERCFLLLKIFLDLSSLDKQQQGAIIIKCYELYRLELTNFIKKLKEDIFKQLEKLKNDQIQESESYTTNKNIKKYFQYLIILKQCPTICEKVFDDYSDFFDKILKEIQSRYDNFNDAFIQKSNNQQSLKKLSKSCLKHSCLDCYLDQEHQFKKLNEKINKILQNYFSQNLQKINLYLKKNDFKNLKILLGKLFKHNSQLGNKSYKQAQFFLLNKINQILNDLPKNQHIKEILDMEKVDKINLLLQIINNNLLDFIDQSGSIQQNIFFLFSKLLQTRELLIQKIKIQTNQYELQQALVNCNNLKLIQTILQQKNPNKQKQYIDEQLAQQKQKICQYDRLKSQIKKKKDQLRKVFLNKLNFDKEFLNLYNKVFLNKFNKKQFNNLKKQVDYRLKSQFDTSIKAWCDQKNIEAKKILDQKIHYEIQYLPWDIKEEIKNKIQKIHQENAEMIRRQNEQLISLQKWINQQKNEQKIAERLQMATNKKQEKIIKKLKERIFNKCINIKNFNFDMKETLSRCLDHVLYIQNLKLIYQNNNQIVIILINTFKVLQQKLESQFKKIQKQISDNLKTIKSKDILKENLIFSQILNSIQILPNIKSQFILKLFDKKFEKIITQFLDNIKYALQNIDIGQISILFKSNDIYRRNQTIKYLYRLKKFFQPTLDDIDIKIAIINQHLPQKQNCLTELRNAYTKLRSSIQIFMTNYSNTITFLQKFSLQDNLHLSKSELENLFIKLNNNFQQLRLYDEAYYYIKGQSSKNLYKYYQEILRQMYSKLQKVLLVQIQKLETNNSEQQYAKINKNLQIMKIFDKSNFTNVLIKSFNRKIKYIIDKGSMNVNKLKTLIQIQKSKSQEKMYQYINENLKKLRANFELDSKQNQKQIEMRKKNILNQQQKNQRTILENQQLNLKQQSKNNSDIIAQQLNQYNKNKLEYIKKQKNQIIISLVNILINLKNIEIHLQCVREFTSTQINDLMKIIETQISKIQLKSISNIIQKLNNQPFLQLFQNFSGFENSEFKKPIKEALNIDQFLKYLTKDNQKTKQKYIRFYYDYQSEYENLIKQYKQSKQKNQSEQILNNILSNIRSQATELKKQYKNKKLNEGYQLIAKIAAVWAILNSKQTLDNQIIFQFKPFPSQIITIFIILGIGDSQVKYELKNRFAEVKKSQGKSLIIAFVACYLALLDYEVDCACQTTYLSLQHRNRYLKLFQKLKIAQSIRYSTLKQACQNLYSQVSIESKIQKILKGNFFNKFNPFNLFYRDKTKQKIVLIDEIHALFYPDFFGKMYSSSIFLRDTTIQNLFAYIWKNKQSTKINIQSSNQYKACISNFARLQDVIKSQIRHIIYCARTWKHQYMIKQGKIGYRKNFQISYYPEYGYRTIFAYFFEFNKGNITTKMRNQFIGLKISIGQLSYLQLIKKFKYIMGVSGNQSLNPNSQKVKFFSNYYNLRQIVQIPSNNKICQKQNLNFKIVKKQQFYKKILEEIDKIMKENRSIIIIFQNANQVYNFSMAYEFKKIRQVTSLLTEEHAQNIRQSIINKMIKPKAIIILTDYYSKGMNFSLDPLLKKNGLHILQTYLSRSVSEQIKLKLSFSFINQNVSFSQIINKQSISYLILEDKIQEIFNSEVEKQSILKSMIYKNKQQKFQQTLRILQNNENTLIKVHDEGINCLKMIAEENNNMSYLNKQNAYPPLFDQIFKVILGINITKTMKKSVQKLKKIIGKLISGFNQLLKNSHTLYFQIVCIRNYTFSAEQILVISTFQNSSKQLQIFLDKIKDYGDENLSATELFYSYANNQQMVNQIILIGDAYSNNRDQTLVKRLPQQKYWKHTQFKQPVCAQEQVNKIIKKQIRIDSISVNQKVNQYYKNISTKTGGNFYEWKTEEDTKIIDFLLSCLNTIINKSKNSLQVKKI